MVQNKRKLFPSSVKTLVNIFRHIFTINVSSFLSLNNQLDVNQSGFGKGHSTETAVTH